MPRLIKDHALKRATQSEKEGKEGNGVEERRRNKSPGGRGNRKSNKLHGIVLARLNVGEDGEVKDAAPSVIAADLRPVTERGALTTYRILKRVTSRGGKGGESEGREAGRGDKALRGSARMDDGILKRGV